MNDRGYELHLGDCLEKMRGIPDGSVDAVITDPPYGTTACKWDTIIPFEPMWEQLKRIAKPKAAIVLFSSQPFTSALVMSNVEMFKYEWIWNKSQTGNYCLAKYQPLKITEAICVFSQDTHKYYPIMRIGKMRKKGGSYKKNKITIGLNPGFSTMSDKYYPTNILSFPNCANKNERVHETQKPVSLMEYLIRTYTNPGETVLDFTMGSGSTIVGCVNTGRYGIGIDNDPDYFAIAEKRIYEASLQPRLIP